MRTLAQRIEHLGPTDVKRLLLSAHHLLRYQCAAADTSLERRLLRGGRLLGAANGRQRPGEHLEGRRARLVVELVVEL